jgi:predicted nucleotidyltransferase
VGEQAQAGSGRSPKVRLIDADVSQRHELARRVQDILCRDERVLDVKLIGSLVGAKADKYSDVDLAVQVRTVSDGDFAEDLPRVVEPVGPLLKRRRS